MSESVLRLAHVHVVYVFSRYGEKERAKSQGEKSPLQLLLATFVHLKNPYQVLIVPLTMWSGFEQGFITADFTKVTTVP